MIEIGKIVNGLRKHGIKLLRLLVSNLINESKKLADKWIRAFAVVATKLPSSILCQTRMVYVPLHWMRLLYWLLNLQHQNCLSSLMEQMMVEIFSALIILQSLEFPLPKNPHPLSNHQVQLADDSQNGRRINHQFKKTTNSLNVNSRPRRPSKKVLKMISHFGKTYFLHKY